MLSSSGEVNMLPSSSSEGSRRSVGSEEPGPAAADAIMSKPVATRGWASVEAVTSTTSAGGGAKAASTAAAGDIMTGVGHLTTGGSVSSRGATEPEAAVSTGSPSKTWTHERDNGRCGVLSGPDSSQLVPPQGWSANPASWSWRGASALRGPDPRECPVQTAAVPTQNSHQKRPGSEDRRMGLWR